MVDAKSKEELEKLADILSDEIRTPGENIVSRYLRNTFKTAVFCNGKKSVYDYAHTNLNKEMIDRGIYSEASLDDLYPHNFNEVSVSRDLQEHRFHFHPKGIPLPREEVSFVEEVPTDFEVFDEELMEFTRDHTNTRITRNFSVDQKVIVNSRGGKAVQSVPFFQISYSHGYKPIPVSRDITAVCNTNEDIKRFKKMVKYLADPTPDKRIKNAASFSQAFHELFKISGLKYGSLEEAGIPLSELYDVVMLTGVPIHEIFGHHFEEPIRFLNFGESATFRSEQNIQNKNIHLVDNPNQRVEGFRVFGFTNVDAYGRKREPRTHIQDGKVVGFLGSEYADPEKLKKYMNLERSTFVGNASQSSDGWFPEPRMSCTVMDGKTEKVDLEGKILLVSHEGHTQPMDKTYMVKAYECYVIKDGEPKRVLPLQVTGGINQALANIILLNDESYQTGLCGKPEPIYYPQSRGQAQVPVSQFAKSQVWAGQQVYPLPLSDIHLKILMDPALK